MSGLVSAIREELANKEFREGYTEENCRRGLAYQITALREARGWSRAEFARRANRPQGNVARWEDPSYGKYSLSTLIEIAAIFDVGLLAKFVGFEELLASVVDLRPSKLAVPSYEQEQEHLKQEYHDQLRGGSAVEAFFKLPKQRRAFGEGALKENNRVAEPISGDERTKVKDQTETNSALRELSEAAAE